MMAQRVWGTGFCVSGVRASMNRANRIDSHPLQSKYPQKRTSGIFNMPAKHFINLTNGIETIRVVREDLGVQDAMFVRIQSSLCERGAYDKILMETDHNLLLHLATGHPCYVYDLASRSKRYGVPRAIWYGLEFIKYACGYCWFGSESELLQSEVLLRGKNVAGEWWKVMRHKVSKPVKQRLKYYSEFVAELGVQELRAYGVVGRATEYDGCKEIYAKMVRDSYELNPSAGADEQPSKEDFRLRLEASGLRVFDHTDPFEHNLRESAKMKPL
mmetsp:Transcript_28808/g.112274  ORF Transcript_28808/g.112274 Transcript_28808/m.112274 type:complete len:272 (-) Transcript_28808:28-843(-)